MPGALSPLIKIQVLTQWIGEGPETLHVKQDLRQSWCCVLQTTLREAWAHWLSYGHASWLPEDFNFGILLSPGQTSQCLLLPALFSKTRGPQQRHEMRAQPDAGHADGPQQVPRSSMWLCTSPPVSILPAAMGHHGRLASACRLLQSD